MQGDLLPLFPLRVVLFPRTLLPLHIFEARYKEMIGEVIASGSEFGVVFAPERGMAHVGCTASVIKVLKRYGDGRMDILAEGRRRFEVLLLNEEKSYLRAQAQFIDDDQETPPKPELVARAIAAYRELRAVEADEVLEEASLDDPQVSFQLAQHIPDVDFRQSLLQIRSESQRLGEIVRFLGEFIPARRRIARVRALAPHNGRGLMGLQPGNPS